MSYASTMLSPVSRVLRGPTLSAMARNVGVVVGAGALAAIYHTTNEEMRTAIAHGRSNRASRRARHEALLVALLGNDISPQARDVLASSRDAYKACMELLANPLLSGADQHLIRQAIAHVTGHRLFVPQPFMAPRPANQAPEPAQQII